jgi:hypothetical protein
MNQQADSGLQGQNINNRADFFGFDQPCQAVATEEENISRLNRVGAFDVHFDFRVWSQRANDYVLLKIPQFIGINTCAPGNFPNPRVVKSELFHGVAANAISPAVADMPDPSPFRAENQGGTGSTHTAEFGVLLADLMDSGIRFRKGPAQSGNYSFVGMLLVQMGNVPHGLDASLFTNRVASHSIRDNENVPTTGKGGGIDSRLGGAGVLIVAALHPHIR